MLRASLMVIGYLIIGLLFMRQNSGKLTATEVSPDKIRTGLGKVNVDGALWLSYEVMRFPEAGISLKLVHNMGYDPFGCAISQWGCEGVLTSLLPYSWHFLQWRSTGGLLIGFDRRLISDQFTHAGSLRHEIRYAGPGSYIVRDEQGREWSYVNGCLSTMEQPGRLKFAYSTEGNRIFEVAQIVDGRRLSLLTVIYLPAGDVSEVHLGGKTVVVCRWEEPKKLSTCSVSSRPVVKCQYKEGLLAEVVEAGGAVIPLTWEANREWFRAGSGWNSPARLCSFGPLRYEYRMDQQGYHITALLPTERIQTIFNPSSGLVYQYNTEGWVYCRN